MQMTAKSTRKQPLRKKIHQLAMKNPLVNEKDVSEALALFTEITRTKRTSSSGMRFRIGSPYGQTMSDKRSENCISTPLLRYNLD